MVLGAGGVRFVQLGRLIPSHRSARSSAGDGALRISPDQTLFKNVSGGSIWDREQAHSRLRESPLDVQRDGAVANDG
jgi:hypothetical protein